MMLQAVSASLQNLMSSVAQSVSNSSSHDVVPTTFNLKQATGGFSLTNTTSIANSVQSTTADMGGGSMAGVQVSGEALCSGLSDGGATAVSTPGGSGSIEVAGRRHLMHADTRPAGLAARQLLQQPPPNNVS